jgi:hypothetical protein
MACRKTKIKCIYFPKYTQVSINTILALAALVSADGGRNQEHASIGRPSWRQPSQDGGEGVKFCCWRRAEKRWAWRRRVRLRRTLVWFRRRRQGCRSTFSDGAQPVGEQSAAAAGRWAAALLRVDGRGPLLPSAGQYQNTDAHFPLSLLCLQTLPLKRKALLCLFHASILNLGEERETKRLIK